MGEITQTLEKLLTQAARLPVEHSPDWRSPCEVGNPDADGMISWRPVKMDPPPDWAGVPLHPDLKEFFGSFWGGQVCGRHSNEIVMLQLAWNRAELARICRSVSQQVAAKEPVLVAVTDSDWYFAVDNESGTVSLGEPGYPPMKVVAPSLGSFLSQIQ